MIEGRHIVTIPYSFKKGKSLTARFEVDHMRPHPCIKDGQWRNTDGLLPEYGRPAQPMKTDIRVNLLRLDHDLKTFADSRKDWAGFDGAPSIVIRGKDMGEICAEVTSFKGGYRLSWRTHYGQSFTDAQRTTLDDAFKDSILSYIGEEDHNLRHRAIMSMTDHMRKEVVAYCQKVDEIRKTMRQIIRTAHT